jgi:lysophospholipase L1-like esterase
VVGFGRGVAIDTVGVEVEVRLCWWLRPPAGLGCYAHPFFARRAALGVMEGNMLLGTFWLGDSGLGGGYQSWNRKDLVSDLFELEGYDLNRLLLARCGARCENVGWYEGGKIVGEVQTRRKQATMLQLEALQPGAGLVVISIGGNDAKYIDVLKGASKIPLWTMSDARIDELTANAYPKVERVYRSVRHRAGEDACIVAIGNANPIPVGGVRSGWMTTFFSDSAQRQLHYAVEALRAMNQSAAAAAGIHYLDPAALFAGHEIGSLDGEWVGGPSIHAFPGVTPMAFHPNANGRLALARELERYLLKGFHSDWPRTIHGLPANAR